jgi:Lrp/AsnC family leucine-responsive transcriptional regulator
VASQVKIDEIDVKILKTLLKDARASFADIARDCIISTNAIVKRFYRLKRTGVIAGTSTMVNMAEF